MEHEPNPSGVALLGAFPLERAEEVLRAVHDLGLGDDRIHMDDAADRRNSLRAEQTEEADRAIVAPHAGLVLTSESARALGITLPVAIVIGAGIGLLLALIPLSGIGLGARLLWFAIAGGAAGAVISFIVTGAMAAKDPFEPGAAQRGVVVRVDDTSPQLRRTLTELDPLRLDLIGEDGQILETIETEEDRTPGGAIEEVGRNVAREQRAVPGDRHR